MMQTFAQYRDNSWKRFKAEYPENTKADWQMCHSINNLMNDWTKELYRLASQGEVLKPVVLDDLYKRAKGMYNQIYHDWRPAFPQGYLNPTARKANQEYERSLIAARKRGRQEAQF